MSEEECKVVNPPPPPNGLYYIPHYLNPISQENVLKLLSESTGIHLESEENQFIQFNIPDRLQYFIDELERFILNYFNCIPTENNFSSNEFSSLWLRFPIFDQIIINKYKPGEGIKSHIDLLKFDDGIVSLSLLSSCSMNFTFLDNSSKTYRLLLKPGDLLILCGEARYKWTHQIQQFQPIYTLNNAITASNCPHQLHDNDHSESTDNNSNNKCLCYFPRISITLRKMLVDENGLCVMQRNINPKHTEIDDYSLNKPNT